MLLKPLPKTTKRCMHKACKKPSIPSKKLWHFGKQSRSSVCGEFVGAIFWGNVLPYSTPPAEGRIGSLVLFFRFGITRDSLDSSPYLTHTHKRTKQHRSTLTTPSAAVPQKCFAIGFPAALGLQFHDFELF